LCLCHHRCGVLFCAFVASSLQGGIRQKVEYSLLTHTATADAKLKMSESAKKSIPLTVSDLHLDSVLESVARGVRITVSSSQNERKRSSIVKMPEKPKRGRPPKVTTQKVTLEEKTQHSEHTVITVDDAGRIFCCLFNIFLPHWL